MSHAVTYAVTHAVTAREVHCLAQAGARVDPTRPDPSREEKDVQRSDRLPRPPREATHGGRA